MSGDIIEIVIDQRSGIITAQLLQEKNAGSSKKCAGPAKELSRLLMKGMVVSKDGEKGNGEKNPKTSRTGFIRNLNNHPFNGLKYQGSFFLESGNPWDLPMH